MSSAMPNLISPYCINGEIQESQWPSNPEILLSEHHQQAPTPQNILTSSSSNGSSGSSTCTIQIPVNLEQLALNDQYATGFPLVDPGLVNSYYEPACHVAGAASNEENTWKPLMANGIAPVSHYPSSDPEPNKPPKAKRIRTAFTDLQLARFEEEFAIHPYVNRDQRNQLALELDLTPKNVKIWFQNRRMKKKTDEKAVTKRLCPTTNLNPQNSCNGYISLSVMAPQEYQTTPTADVMPSTYRYSYAVSSNLWNSAQIPTTSVYPIRYTNQGQEELEYQNLEGQIMHNELVSSSTSNEFQMQAVNSGQQATWIPSYFNNVTTEVQPHMQQGPQ